MNRYKNVIILSFIIYVIVFQKSTRTFLNLRPKVKLEKNPRGIREKHTPNKLNSHVNNARRWITVMSGAP